MSGLIPHNVFSGLTLIPRGVKEELEKIRANGTKPPEGATPVLSNVKVIVGEATAVNNGTVINGYGEEATNVNGTVRPVAYVPLDQFGNIIP